jgi:peptide-methionine (S)-S-oxide reductase
VEAAFRRVPGVTRTTVGYLGGQTTHPSYEQVCAHTTGHAEAVQVEYDPAQVSYETLLEAFLDEHDPTQLNRQGPDVGDQYRSAVFVHSAGQRQAAEKALADRAPRYRSPIVTQVVDAGPAGNGATVTFWPAEDYHQQYLEKRGHASCALPTS